MERVQWFQLHSGERLLSNQAGRVIRRGGGAFVLKALVTDKVVVSKSRHSYFVTDDIIYSIGLHKS